MAEKKIFLCGLPASGKSTFLGAFWYLLNHGSGPLAVRLHKLHGDNTYMNELSGDWVNVRDVSRTSTSHDVACRIELQDWTGKSVGFLDIPDISGEKFSAQWKDREIANEVMESEANSIGLCLFINPEKLKKDITIADANFGGVVSAATEVNPAAGNEQKSKELISWTEDLSETQVVLIQVLLDILVVAPQGVSLKIAIVLSAWDLLKSQNKKPLHWLTENLPMFGQTLTSNANRIEFRVYGVSALGGSIQDEKLKSVDPPEKRIEVYSNKSEGNDITVPIAWLFGVQG
jgi:hypothetical protein